MKNRKALLWQIAMYVVAVAIVIATGVSIWLDRDNIAAYYQAKQSEGQVQDVSLSEYFQGEGTERSPYLIASAEDLATLREVVAEKASTDKVHFMQIEDIDLQGIKWEPIGTQECPFRGIYDGGGHKISNLTIEQAGQSFFGIWSGEIRNIHFADPMLANDYCAVIASTANGSSARIINCIVSSVRCSSYVREETLAVIASELNGGSVVNTYTFDVPEGLLFAGYSDSAYRLLNCGHDGELLAWGPNMLQQNCFDISLYSPEQWSEYANAFMQGIGENGIAGEYNFFGVDEQGNSCFLKERNTVYSAMEIIEYHHFLKMSAVYAIAAIVVICGAFIVSRAYRLNLGKCVFYGLMGTYTLIMLIAGFATRGASLETMLYDVKVDGVNKFFTDFSDCILPSIDPYTRVNTYYTSIYPPLISLVFALLNHFVPLPELVDTIAARNSQIGMMLFMMWTLFWCAVLYETVMHYKKGKKSEKSLFIVLLCMSYPFIHCLERGNVVYIVGILIALFLYNYRSESFWKRQFAFLCLSAAAGIKIYPAVLGILLIVEKRYRDTFNCIAMGIVVNLLPSVFFRTGLASIVYMMINATTYVGGNSFVGGKIDLSHFIQIPGALWDLPMNLDPAHYMREISMVILVLTVLILVFSRMAEWKKYLICVMDLILLAPFSPYYYILYAIGPLMMFLDSTQKKAESVLYGFLLSGIFMTFVSKVKYPLAAFAQDQVIWHMTVISGSFVLLLQIVLLAEGIYSCTNRLIQTCRKKYGK